MASEDSD
jgi:hypothetical protein